MRLILSLVVAFLFINIFAFVAKSEQPLAISPVQASTPWFVWTTEDDGLTLRLRDELILRYVFCSGRKPIVYPLLGPGGVSMTRDYPMKKTDHQLTDDHPHHRSFWFTHGEVNDVDYWLESDHAGRIVHEKVLQSDSNEQSATLKTTANWRDPKDRVVLQETRLMSITDAMSLRTIDVTIDLKAIDGDVHFGDTKEGTFAVRVPDSMAVDQQQGGAIENAEGFKNGDAWGKRSRWVDYSGPIAGRTMGIAMLEHPTSFAHPCRWHVRTYGLFAANPFGESHFTGSEKTKGATLPDQATMHLRYRLLLHDGATDAAMIERQWKQFSEQ